MKKFFICLLLLSMFIIPQSYHTIKIDGVNDFDKSYEELTTTSSTIKSYLTFDKDYIYIGFSGSTNSGNITDDNRVFAIYIDTDPQKNPLDGNGSSIGAMDIITPTIPIKADYYYSFHTYNNIVQKLKYNNAVGWEGTEFNESNYKGAGYWEARISRKDIGNPSQIYLIAYVMEDWKGYLGGGIPSTLFEDTDLHSFDYITFNNHYINLYLIDQIIPSSNYNVDNYQWITRIKASAGAIADTLSYIGMSNNALDSYDNSIDIPNPPTPPANYIDVYFPRSNWPSQLGPQYSRDIRKMQDLSNSNINYSFSVTTDKINTDIILSADCYNYLPSNYKIILHDLQNNVYTDLKNSSYSINSGTANLFNFDLFVGKYLASPKIYVNPSSLDFGSMKRDLQKSLSLSIKNNGDSILTVSNITIDNNLFTTNAALPITLKKDSTKIVSIKFSPVNSGTFTGNLTIFNNDNSNSQVVIPLKGIATNLEAKLAVSADTLNYNNVGVDSQSDLYFYAKNNGDTTLCLSNLITNNPVFTLQGNSSRQILLNDSIQIHVAFRPAAVSNYSGVLQFNTNDPSNTSKSIVLKGNGVLSLNEKVLSAGWNLISIPVTPTNSSAQINIGDDISSYYLFNFDNKTGYNLSSTIITGHGYWLGIESNCNLDITGTPLTSNFERTLNKGWDLISTPFKMNYLLKDISIKKNSTVVNIDSAVTLGWIQKSLYGYENTTKSYYSADTLKTWNGYWLPVLTDSLSVVFTHDLVINKLKNLEEADSSGWKVNIYANLNNANDNLLCFGINENASDIYDVRFDFAKPPLSPASDAVQTYFVLNGNNSGFDKFATDIKGPLNNDTKNWQFTFFSKVAGTVKLKWEELHNVIPKAILDKYDFVLSGSSLDKNYDMKILNEINFIAEENSAYNFYINSKLTGVGEQQTKVNDFILNQNYPNPFNPTTKISYNLNVSGNVKLIVYNMLGEMVSNLLNKFETAGTHEIIFNASNLPSGIYYYKIIFNGLEQIKKMILLK